MAGIFFLAIIESSIMKAQKAKSVDKEMQHLSIEVVIELT